jgi:hypothetical protein
MGYRSQVRSLIYGDPDLICALVAECTLTLGDNNPLKTFEEDLRRYRIERSIYDHEATCAQEPDDNGNRPPVYRDEIAEVLDLSGDSWKWYESYPDVQSWERLLLRAEELGLSTEFMRIGEETSDIECRHCSADDSGDTYLVVSSRIIDDIPDEIPVDYSA